MRLVAAMISLTVTLAACGTASNFGGSALTYEDTSPSGTVASAVGGALSATSYNGGAQALLKNNSRIEGFHFFNEALAESTSCPTFMTAAGSTCTADGSGNLWLTYSDCTFGAATARWVGVQALTLSGPIPLVNCGVFPHPLANHTLSRQFVLASMRNTPAFATVITASGIVTTIDHATSNLGNFDNATISPKVGTGYGAAVGFNSGGARISLDFAEHISAVNSAGTALLNHSVYTKTPLTISEDLKGSASRTVSGTVILYHNLLKVVGTSTLTNLTHKDTCCFPTSGTISTTFAAGVNSSPATEGSALVGKSETLTFTGCGTGTLVNSAGTSTNVTFSRCL